MILEKRTKKGGLETQVDHQRLTVSIVHFTHLFRTKDIVIIRRTGGPRSEDICRVGEEGRSLTGGHGRRNVEQVDRVEHLVQRPFPSFELEVEAVQSVTLELVKESEVAQVRFVLVAQLFYDSVIQKVFSFFLLRNQ